MKVLCIEGATFREEEWDEFTTDEVWYEALSGELDEYTFEEYDFEDVRVIQAVEKVEGDNFIFVTKKEN